MINSTLMVTGQVRFNFVNAFRPKKWTFGGDEKYSVTLLIPKTDVATIAKIRNAIEAAKTWYLSKHPDKQLPSDLNNPLHDGDGERPNGGEYGDECKGHYVMSVKSKSKPKIVYSDRSTPIVDPQELYNGCYGRAMINFFVYDVKGNKGISAGFVALMKLSDGEPLTGRTITSDSWGDELNDVDVVANGQ